MYRQRALRITLGAAGSLFVALPHPLVLFVRQDPALAMMFSVYVTPGSLHTVSITAADPRPVTALPQLNLS